MNPRNFLFLLILGILVVTLETSFQADAAAPPPATTTIVNYNFNAGTSFATLTPTLAPGITSTASGTQPFQLGAGTATDASAFTPNIVADTGLLMSDSSGTNTKYFQFQIGGASLPLNEKYKVYVQGLRTASGATTITLAYSTNGTTFTNLSDTLSTGLGAFTSKVFDLSSISELDHRSTIYFRLLVSGAPNPSAGLVIDNFQVQAETVTCPSALTVNSTADTSDTAPGDGVCDDGAGNCTLRAALEESNALTFCGSTININFTVNGAINLNSSLPTITRAVNLNGRGANSLAISGNGSFRLLNILLSSASTMSISDLTFTGGGKGPGQNATAVEFNNNGTLNLNRVEFAGNSGPSGSSVIFSNAAAALNINSCSIHHNPVEHVVMIGNTPFEVTNSTISNNTGGTGAAILVFGGTVNSNITGSTITNNNQGLWHANTTVPSTVTLRNSIFSQNGGINLRRTGTGTCTENGILSNGFNLIDNDPGSSLCTTATSDLIGASFNPQLLALGYYGGTTQSRPPAITSPAIDKGRRFSLTTDQRVSRRPHDIQGVANAAGGDGSDIGAVEAGLMVNSLADTGDATPDGVCDDGAGNCTLREALQEANFVAGADTITFAPNVTGTINLGSALPMVTQPVNIVGPGANSLAISGNGTFRLLNILLSTASTMSISDVSFRGGGKAAGENATAVEFNDNGTLNLNRVEFLNNSGPFGSSVIFSNAAAALNLNACSLHHNSVEHVLMIGNTPFTVTNSTISNNTGTGAGILIFGGTLNSIITASTIANNNQGLWHANSSVPSSVTIRNSIFSQNGGVNLRRTGTATCAENGILSGGYNLIDNDPGSSLCSIQPTDLIGTSFNPRLTPLGNHGGPTRTQALMGGSAALDKGRRFGLTTDQRGQTRPFDNPSLAAAAGGDQSDIGAFELQSACSPISIGPALPNWNTSRAYNQTLTASGGSGPYTFTVVEGSLPNGLTLNSNGVLTGTPAAIGTFNFTVLATDAVGCFGMRSYTVVISECTAISLSPATLPNGAPGVSYSRTITASGGISPYAFTASGSLPAGLTLSAAGVLSGTPTVVGVFDFSVTATSNNGCQGTQSYQIIINAPPSGISLSNSSIAENSVSGSSVGTFNTTDADSNSFVYTLVTGTGSDDNASFSISEDQLLTNAIFDFEAKSSYSIRVRSMDQTGLFFEKQFSVSVVNVNESPTISDISNQVITTGSTTGALAFTIGDPETSPASLTVSGSSNNPALVAQITFTGIGANRSVTITPTSQVGIATITITVSDGTLFATDEFEVTVGDAVTAGQVQISEFRFRGPDADDQGPLTASANEYIELYNTTNADIFVSANDGSAGWALVASDGQIRFIVPNGTVIPALGHFLAVNTAGYGLTGYAAGDLSYTLDIPDDSGIALFNNATTFNLTTRLDAVGFANVSDPLYREGAGLTPSGGITADVESAFVRQFVKSVHSDTGNNNTDFQFVSTDGGTYNGRRSLLGAPGPQSTLSARNSNSSILVSMLDPAVAPSVAPNRVRDLTSNPAGNATYGTLSIRRRVTNNTGLSISVLRFRVIEITALPTDTITADVRALSSSETSAILFNTTVVQVLGTTLETPPSQPSGGGLNSTLTVTRTTVLPSNDKVGPTRGRGFPVPDQTVTLAEPLAPGESVNIQFLLGVQRPGAFRFYVSVEAVNE